MEGGANPISGKVPTDAERVTWAIPAASHPKSLYHLLLRSVRWRRERNWSESTQIYTQVSIRALQAVHASTQPEEQRGEKEPDSAENKGHNDTTYDTTSDTTKGAQDEHNPLQNR